jgi:hypothetical protein
MAVVIRMRCLACAARVDYVDSVLMATLADGTKHVLRHPGEGREAEELGTSLSELSSAGRLRRARPFLCSSCGTVAYSSTGDSHCDACALPRVPVGGDDNKVDGCAVLVLAAIGAAIFAVWELALVALCLAGIVTTRLIMEKRRYRRSVSELRCWSCGEPRLKEEAYAIS